MSEFAPLYSKKERLVHLLKIASWGVPLVVISNWYLIPNMTRYIQVAHCDQILGFNGLTATFYLLFSIIPALFGMTLLAIEGPRALKVFKVGQSPLPGEKVLRKTRYQYGWKAKVKPTIMMFVVGVFFCIAVFGHFVIQDLMADFDKSSLELCEYQYGVDVRGTN